MRFTWDERKRKTKIAKHRIDFVDIPALFAGITVTVVDDMADYGEERFKTVGLLQDVTIIVVHTETATRISIISARKASHYEEKCFVEKIAN